MKNELYFNDEIIEKICALDEVIVYGAGVMGQALKLCLESKPYDKPVDLFIVKKADENPKKIGNTKVLPLDKAKGVRERTIIVALNEMHMSGAIEELHMKGFEKLLLLNAAGDEWSHIKANFFLNNPEKCYIPFRMIERGNRM